MQTPEILGIIAGNGVYPRELALAARKAGVKKIVAAAFSGAGFLSDQADSSSFGMAMATAVAMLCYAICLRITAERPSD